MHPNSWLAELLRSRGIERPDGRMLYGYRLSEEEYQTLRETLNFSINFGDLAEVTVRIRSFPALFVLYAAEWWRREYQGGAWRWTPIVNSFGGDSKQLLPNARSECVKRGFAYWGHQPSGEGKKFFGAIVAHGGLPLKFIGQGSGKFAAIMAYALRLAARYRWDESLIIEAIAERAEELPDSLRRQEIYELIARMVATVLELKQEFQLVGMADPIGALTERDRHWRQRFPLPLEDSTAQSLLSGLVTEAAQQVQVAPASVFTIERFLRQVTDGRYELMSMLTCPSTMSVETLVALFGLKSNDRLPRYFSIDAQVVDREPFAEGRQVLGAETATAVLAIRKRTWRSADACAEHAVYIRGSNGDLRDSPLTVPGGGGLPGAEPWIFVSRDGKFKWVASGGARVPEEEALVALPIGWKIDPAGLGSMTYPAGVLDFGAHQVELHTIRGDVLLKADNGSYRVRTKQATGIPDTYVWEGRRVTYSSTPQAIYIGVPKLVRYSPEGQQSRVPIAEQSWFVAGTNIPIQDANTARGPVDIYLTRDGERLTRFRFVVLDSAAHIEFKSGASASRGAICLDTWGCADVTLDEQSGLESEIEKSASNIEILLRGGDIPPESILLTMRWARCAIEVCLRLPFPSSGGRFFDSMGVVLRDKDELTLRHLIGARLRIFDHNPQDPKKYSMNMALVRNVQNLRYSDLKVDQDIILLRDGTAEIRLIDLQKNIESLMSFSDELDAAVEITLCVSGRPEASVRISRYEVSLELDSVAVSFPARAIERLGAALLERVSVLAIPLSKMDRDPVSLTQGFSEGVPTAVWRIAELDAEQAPWLIYPGEESSVFFRPTVWLKRTDSIVDGFSESPTCPLAQAVGISAIGARMDAIAHVLDNMSVDFNHPSWQLLERMWEVFHHLPLSSLDVFRALAAHPAAAVALLFSQIPEDTLFEIGRRLRDELGFMWELTSVHMWRNVVGNLRNYYVPLLGEAGAKLSYPIILNARLDRLAKELPTLKLLLDLVKYEETESLSGDLAEVLRSSRTDRLSIARRLWRGDDALAQNLLFRGHANDSNWPERNFFEAAFKGFSDSAANTVKMKLSGRDVAASMFWLRTDDFKVSVANMPVLCALWSATDTIRIWWSKPERQLALRKIKAFDPIWFERAFQEAFAACVSLDILVPETTRVTKT